MVDTFYVDGVSLASFGVYWDGSQLFAKPRKDVEFYSVPGRSGDLFKNNDRFDNININVNCHIREDFIDQYDLLMNFLYSREGYVKLTNSKEPNVYRMGQFVDANEPSTGAFLRDGSFTLVFNCMPQKFYETESTMTVNVYDDTGSSRQVYAIELADGSNVQMIMRNVPEEFRSNAPAYYIFNPPTDFGTGGNTATNVAMNWSNSSAPMYVFWEMSSTPYYYTSGNVTGVSFAVPTIPSENVPPTGMILTPMQLEGKLTVTGRYNGSNFSFQSADFSTKTASITEQSALGADVSLTWEHCCSVSDIYLCTLMVSGFNGNDEKGRLYIQNRTPSDELKNKLLTYSVTNGNKRYIQMKADLNTLDVYAYKDGLPDLNLNSCFVIAGDLGKNFNTLKGFFFAYGLPSWGQGYTAQVKARWWKL